MKERGPAIVLIGFMGAGKTTVGRALARLTEWPLYDTDDAIAARFGMPVEEIFISRGEEIFREAECESLVNLPAERAIIATGGGIVLRQENIDALRKLGSVTYLAADEETLFARISQSGGRRPLLQTEDPRATLKKLLRVRDPLYRAAANHIVDTTRLNATDAAEAIIAHVG